MMKQASESWFKITLGCSVVLLSLAFLLTLTLYQRGGELRVLAQYFPQNLMSFSKLTDATPFESEIGDRRLVDEMLMRYYLEMRHSIIPDKAEMMERWGWNSPMAMLSTPDVHAPIADNLEKKLEKMPPIITSIDIVRVQRPKDSNRFNVDFDVYMLTPMGQLDKTRRNVILEFAYVPNRRIFSPFFTNPYGLTFFRYEEVSKKSS